MSKLQFYAITVGLSSIIAIGYATVDQNSQREVTPLVVVSDESDLDEQSWLDGDDLPNEQKSTPPSMLIPTAQTISFFEERIDKHPTDPRNYVMLGRLNLRYAKETDDFSKYVLAERHFKKAIELDDQKFVAHTYLGRAYLAQHRFSEAAVVAEKAWEANAKNELALATIGDAALQLGDYDKAAFTFEKLLKSSETAPLLARLARVKELTGDAAQSFALLEKAANLQANSSGNPSDEAWYFWRLGEFKFNQGDLKSATQYLKRALSAAPNDAHSLASLAKVQAALGKYEEAIGNYSRSITFLDAPPTRLALGMLLESQNEIDKAEAHFLKAEKAMNEEAQDRFAGPAHARERALYMLQRNKDLPAALEIAMEDLKIRKDIYAYDLLAWAQFKNGQYTEAAKSIAKAMETGTLDASIWFHAGMIHAELNDVQNSLAYLNRAMELNAFFDLHSVNEAKTVINTLKQKNS